MANPTETEVINELLHVMGTGHLGTSNIRYLLDPLFGHEFADKHYVKYGSILSEYGLATVVKREDDVYCQLTSKGIEIHNGGGWLKHLQTTSKERLDVSPVIYQLREVKNRIKNFKWDSDFQWYWVVLFLLPILFASRIGCNG